MRFRSKTGKRHLLIPDTQVRPGVKIDHLAWMAFWALDRNTPFDTVVHIGDHYDMPSLSSYDKPGSRAVEGRRVTADLEAGHRALELIHNIWDRRGFHPAKHVTLGNHENRVMRAVELDAKLDGLVGQGSFAFLDLGWQVHDFLDPVVIDSIKYCHYFPLNRSGRVGQTKAGCPSARDQVMRVGSSATAGHQQGLDVHFQEVPGGKRRVGLIAGSFYQHDEGYMSPMGQGHWRGIVACNDVHGGSYDPCFVSIEYLAQKYGRMRS